MIIREYQSADCKELTELFYNTVHTVNAKDYGALLRMLPLRQDLFLRIEVIKLSKSNKWCDRVSRLQILLWRNADKF